MGVSTREAGAGCLHSSAFKKNVENVPILGCFSDQVKYLDEFPEFPFCLFVVSFRNGCERLCPFGWLLQSAGFRSLSCA